MSFQVLFELGHCEFITPLRRLDPLPVRQTSALASALASASSGFAVTRDTLAVRLTLLLAECVEDYHLQVRARPCRAHKKKALRENPQGPKAVSIKEERIDTVEPSQRQRFGRTKC